MLKFYEFVKTNIQRFNYLELLRNTGKLNEKCNPDNDKTDKAELWKILFVDKNPNII